jgi:hypothetical protein
MRKWSGWLLVLAIAAIVTTGGILSQRYLDRSAYDLASQLERVQQAVDHRDWRESADSFEALEKRWTRVHSNWALITDHMELDNLELSLVRLREFIESRDEVNARVEAGGAMDMIRHIPERERLTWRNIF